MKLKTKKIIKLLGFGGLLFSLFVRPVFAEAPASHSVYHSLVNNYGWIQWCVLPNPEYQNAVNIFNSNSEYDDTTPEDVQRQDTAGLVGAFLLNGGYGTQMEIATGKSDGTTTKLSAEASDNIRNCLLVAGPPLQELIGQTPRDMGTGTVGGSSGPVGPCQADANLLSFPTWYKYLSPVGAECEPQIRSLKDVWLVAAAILDIILRLGALLSVGFIIWAGFRFLTSQGDPNTIKESRDTIINAVIGLVITIIAAVSVDFVAGRF